jgi:hypothetical protein
MSPEVGDCWGFSTAVVGEEPSLSADRDAGETCKPRWDLRLCFSIMLTAQASRSTGVRLAACKKASLSCKRVSLAICRVADDHLRIALVGLVAGLGLS